MAHDSIIKRTWPGVKGVIRMWLKFKVKGVKRTVFFGILAGAGLIGVLFYVISRGSNPSSMPVTSGSWRRAAPDFSLKDRESREYSLHSWRGKPVLVHFWASWCAPCLEEVGRFAQAAAQERTERPIWVAISEDQSWLDAEKILPPGKPSVVSLLDQDEKVAALFGTYQYPETYLISEEGLIVAKWVGPQSWDLDGEIFRLLKALK